MIASGGRSLDVDQHGRTPKRTGPVVQPTSARIVVVDDDERVRRLLRNIFETSGFRVSEARNEAELVALVKTKKIALITLDLTLRHEDGLAIARRLRTHSNVPIVMVTGRGHDVDRIVGLELGADDYIVKPFNVREVVARVRAVLRRTQLSADPMGAANNEILRFGSFEIDLAALELRTAAGRPVALTSAEFKLLEAFARRPGRVLSRDTLIDEVCGVSAAPLQRSIDTIVGRLRKKIEADCAVPQIIKTVRGEGYIFTAKLRA
jgi:two-component system, OmpR family, response regulator